MIKRNRKQKHANNLKNFAKKFAFLSIIHTLLDVQKDLFSDDYDCDMTMMMLIFVIKGSKKLFVLQKLFMQPPFLHSL